MTAALGDLAAGSTMGCHEILLPVMNEAHAADAALPFGTALTALGSGASSASSGAAV